MILRLSPLILAAFVGFAPIGFCENVKLGVDDLTSGIPGEGPLKLSEIKSWLADPKNHAELSVELPEGLEAGADAIYIPKDNPLTRAKIELGRQLYFETRLSVDNTISCASCHHPDHGFGFDTQFGVGVRGQTGNRNSPIAYNRILSKEQFWDGRADSLEAQAVGPIANPIEMGHTHEAVVEFLGKNPGYRVQFEKVFGQPPTIDDVGKAIASFERVIVTGNSPYDLHEPVAKMEKLIAAEFDDLEQVKEEEPEMYERFMELKAFSDRHPMSESAIRGQALFFGQKANCTACHVGANFADEKYHNLGVGMDSTEPDVGRKAVTGDVKDTGAFKTPTVRNVALTAPYMHDGSQATLKEVVEWYAKGGHPNPYLSDKVKKFEVTEQEVNDLVAFMEALTGPFPKIEDGRLPK